MLASYKSIQETCAFEKLSQLAQSPYDLTQPGALQADDRLQRYQVAGKAFKLFYATEQVDDRVLSGLQEIADECQLVSQYRAMRTGAIMNRIDGFVSENRRVLHTATRDLFSGEPAEGSMTLRAKRELEKLSLFLDALDAGEIVNEAGEAFTTIVQVGIGGSDLGPRAVYEALKSYTVAGRKAAFISNVDPDDVSMALADLDLGKTLFNIVSKSGSTLETVTNEAFVRRALRENGYDPARHCIAITGEGSPMDNPDRYLASFYLYDCIGGRYSTTSMVGCVLLGFTLGFEQVTAFLRGAADMDNSAEEADILKNIPLIMALLGIWNRNFLDLSSLAIIPYSQALYRFPAHLQQCDMESNGKSVDRQGRAVQGKTGPIIWGETGSNSQHAFFQHIYQGTSPVPIEFIGFSESQRGKDIEVQGCTSQQKLLANLFAQMVALACGKKDQNLNKFFAGNRPSCLLFAKKLTPYVMGSLLACYEAKIVFQGFAWNINSFDQEGVQLGKELARRFLREIGGAEEGFHGIESAFLDEVQRGV